MINYSDVSSLGDDDFDRDDLTYFLETLLSDARKNKSESGNCENQIKQTKEILSGVHNGLVEYDVKNAESN